MILVTGSTSRIGKEAVFDLVLQDVQLRVMIYGGVGNEWENWSNVETLMGDFAKPESMDAALEGIDTALLLSSAGARHIELQTAFIDACVRAGVKHVVKISAIGADPLSSARVLKRHGASEAHLAASGMRATIVRSNLFMQGVLNNRGPILERQKFSASLEPAARVSMVDVRDVASVVARKLLEADGPSETLEVTGPAALTQPEVAAAIALALGKPVAYEPLSTSEFAELLAGVPVPRDAAEGTVELYDWYNTGGAAEVTDTVARIVGRPPTDLATYLEKFKDRFDDTP